MARAIHLAELFRSIDASRMGDISTEELFCFTSLATHEN